VALASGCSSGDDDAAGGGNKTSSGATGGTTGGTGTAGQGGTGATGGTTGGGMGGTSATGGAGGTGGSTGGSGGSGGTGGSTGGSAGAATGGATAGGMGGSAGAAAGSPATGGAPAGGMAGSLGSGGAAAGNGGGGMPAVTLVTPIMRSSTSYVLEFGDTYFEVNPAVGARVVDVHLKGGTNLLGHGMDADNMGSTFWPSPQAAWTWPPTGDSSIANINSKPYMATADATSMTLVGMAASVVGLSVTKKFAADLTQEAVIATYTMIGTAAGKSAAPWEVTRFAQSGVTFFPSGGTVTTAKNTANNMDPAPTTTSAGCQWVSSPGVFASASSKDQLLVLNGVNNWLAHADAGWVVVKKFTNTPASMIATGEGEIDIYMNNPGNSGNPLPYMEVEEQGPYGAVGQGQMVNWTVIWFVRKLPDGVTATAGNQQLVDFVKSIVQ
ncbi:MAG TPA: DUF4380 domain-containing protein, partial [Polyangiaceae bacterium]|nr:DUF4380 domain-containing protein [Polyangiaceae bacterium]